MAEPPPDELDLVLRPHRSLPPTGFWIVIGIVAVWSFVGGAVFVLVGAWPVLGFAALALALVWIALRVSYRDARAYERLRLANGELTVERVDRRGAAELLRLPAYWLRVTLERDADRPGDVVLSSHGKRLVVGAFLPPDQRETLAATLRDALARARATPLPGA